MTPEQEKEHIESLLLQFTRKKNMFDAEQKNFEHYKKNMCKDFDKYCNKYNLKQIEITDYNCKYKVTNINNTKIEYNVDQIEKIAPNVINKQITIADWNSFVNVLKGYGVRFKDIKPLLLVNKSVDGKKLDNELQLGNVDHKQITKYCKLISGDSYIKIAKREEPEVIND